MNVELVQFSDISLEFTLQLFISKFQLIGGISCELPIGSHV